jgi:hypothetical protein
MSNPSVNKARSIAPTLIKAYRQAHYVINLPNSSLTLRIGQVESVLAKFMASKGVGTAAFLTAFNPYSQKLGEFENEVAQRKLTADLLALNVLVIYGEGKDADGHWLGEPSLLALGISMQDAEILADRYGQNAFIWVGNCDCVPNLRLRHPIAVPTEEEAKQWIALLAKNFQAGALQLPLTELAWVMSVPDSELPHWLDASSWDLSMPWPLAKPDGSAMGIGTELDRMFRLISAGIQRYSL